MKIKNEIVTLSHFLEVLVKSKTLSIIFFTLKKKFHHTLFEIEKKSCIIICAEKRVSIPSTIKDERTCFFWKKKPLH